MGPDIKFFIPLDQVLLVGCGGVEVVRSGGGGMHGDRTEEEEEEEVQRSEKRRVCRDRKRRMKERK